MLANIKRLFRGPNSFHSKFGGLWIDRANAQREFDRRVASGRIPPDLAPKIATFMADGYAILEGAVPPALASRLAEDINAAYQLGDPRLRYHTDGAEHHVLTANTPPRGKRMVEAHAVLPDVRAVLASAPIMRFLDAIFDEPPVLTQSLIFQNGSEQGFHQDPAFVPFDQPLQMAAAWVALEDIRAGSGELQYIVKSHLLPDYIFSTGRRDSHGANPGEVDQFCSWVLSESDRRKLQRQTFLAKKGDVLIWHAGLAHGGSPITDPSATRQSVVGHFCPKSVRPSYPNADIRRQDGSLLYSSYIYDLNEVGVG